MTKRTTIDHQMVELLDTVVTLYDAEWYGHKVLYFDSVEKAEQCYRDTVAILTEAHNKLTQAGWSQAKDWEYMTPEEDVS